MNIGYAGVGDVDRKGRGRPRKEETAKVVEQIIAEKREKEEKAATVAYTGRGIYQFKKANGTTKLFRFVKEVRFTVRTKDAEEIAWLDKQKGIERVA